MGLTLHYGWIVAVAVTRSWSRNSNRSGQWGSSERSSAAKTVTFVKR